jgi:hypothetical protein
VSTSVGEVGGSSLPDPVSRIAVEVEGSYRSSLLRAVHWAVEDKTVFDSLGAKWEVAHTAAAAEAMRIVAVELHLEISPSPSRRHEALGSYVGQTWRTCTGPRRSYHRVSKFARSLSRGYI